MNHLQILDYLIIAIVMLGLIGVGMYFTKKGGQDMDSFFLGGRSLKWYIAGTSMIATSFAADTPLWVSALVRSHGIHYIWQFWAPLIGATFGVVYFSRKWRRMAFVTDIEFMEARYGGGAAKTLRAWWGGWNAIFMCPLICAWVIKAMETISREALGLPSEYQVTVTVTVIVIAVLMCGLSGLFGVVYTDFIQFLLATFGTVLLAILSVRAVGGLDALSEQLTSLKEWSGNGLSIAPKFGDGPGEMSVWNGIGFFGFLWLIVALSTGYQAQRLLACKTPKQASYSQFLFSIVYYAFMSWPWIIVALCSIILLPELGTDDQAAAYPRMIVTVLPVGLRGVLVAALLAAFISTISTLFNWGSSYLVNDLYRRFINPNASEKSYVKIARCTTLLMAVAGAYISLIAKDIQQLLTLAYVLMSAGIIPGLLRWLWWRTNGKAEIAGMVAGWVMSALLLFVRAFDGPAAKILNLEDGVAFSSDGNLVGARMLLVVTTVALVVVVTSLLTQPEDMGRLKKFVLRARPFAFGWKPVIRELGEPYHVEETLPRTLVSWALAATTVGCSVFGIGRLLLGPRLIGLGLMAIAVVAAIVTIRRIRKDCANDVEHGDFLEEVGEAGTKEEAQPVVSESVK